MKRIISLLLSAILVFSAAGVLAAEITATVDALNDEAFLCKAELLSELGVLDETDTDYSKQVNRLEFAGFLAGLLGVRDNAVTDFVYFNDTTETYINNLVAMGIISGCSDGRFEPGRIITSGEAVTMVMRALGYREFVETRGGGVFEYSREAMKTGLVFNKELNTEIRLSDVVEMFFDLLEKNILDINAVTVEGERLYATYSDENQISLIEAYRGLKLIRGQVTANYLTTIGETKPVTKEQIAVNNTIYKCYQPDAFSYIGQSIIAVYNKQFECITFLTSDTERMDVFELDSKEILGYNNFVLTYQLENTKSLKKINFDRKVLKVVYNGKAIDTDFKSAFEIGMGTVRLYSVDGTKNYTVAVIEAYVDVTVKLASTETFKVYTNGTGDMSALDFSDAGDEGVYKKLFSAESDLEIGVKSVAENDLISVCCSRDMKYIVGYICSESVTGEIKSLYSKGGSRYVNINGEDYIVSPYYKGLNIKTGKSGKFIKNKFGFIGKVDEIKVTASQIAYLYGVSGKTEAFSSEVMVKIYTETKEHIVYSLTDKVIFNGTSIPKEAVKTNLMPEGKLLKGLIKYTVNSQGKVSVIDTGRGDTFFSEMTTGTQTLKFVEQNRAFGQNGEYVMTRGTKIFMVPRNDERHIPENFNVVYYRESMTPAFTTEETVRIYQDNEDPFVEYVVCFYNNRKTTIYGSGSIHMMVEEVVTEVTDDGNTISIIKGYSNCMPFEIAVTDDVQVLAYAGVDNQGVDVLEPGDWIVGTTNATGNLSYMLLMYNADADVFNPSKPGVHAFFDSQGKLTNANYYDGDVFKIERGGKDNSEVLIVLGNKETGQIRNCIVLDEKLMKFMMYDDTKENNKISVGNVDDIVSLEMTNGSNCDRVYFEFRSNSRLTNMAVYRH